MLKQFFQSFQKLKPTTAYESFDQYLSDKVVPIFKYNRTTKELEPTEYQPVQKTVTITQTTEYAFIKINHTKFLELNNSKNSESRELVSQIHFNGSDIVLFDKHKTREGIPLRVICHIPTKDGVVAKEDMSYLVPIKYGQFEIEYKLQKQRIAKDVIKTVMTKLNPNFDMTNYEPRLEHVQMGSNGILHVIVSTTAYVKVPIYYRDKKGIWLSEHELQTVNGHLTPVPCGNITDEILWGIISKHYPKSKYILGNITKQDTRNGTVYNVEIRPDMSQFDQSKVITLTKFTNHLIEQGYLSNFRDDDLYKYLESEGK